MSDNKSLMIKQENIFSKILNFFKNIFKKKEVVIEENLESNYELNKEKQDSEKNDFINELRKSTDEENLINSVNKDPSLLKSMSIEKLKQLNEAIKNKQEMLDVEFEMLKKEGNMTAENN